MQTEYWRVNSNVKVTEFQGRAVTPVHWDLGVLFLYHQTPLSDRLCQVPGRTEEISVVLLCSCVMCEQVVSRDPSSREVVGIIYASLHPLGSPSIY